MAAGEILSQLKTRFETAIRRVDVPQDNRLFAYVTPESVRPVCQFLFRDLDARYVTSIGADDRPFSGAFLVAHDFALAREGVLASILTFLPGERPAVDSVTDLIPGANWAEREFRDLLGIEPVGHATPKRLILPDGWPESAHPLRRDVPWNYVPVEYDETREYDFERLPDGCIIVPFGPFHPTLDEPAHFRLYVDGETVRGCEYRGFMAHRGIEKLADSVLTYNEIPVLAERICGICGCVHSVTYTQAVEQAAALRPPVRAEFIRTIMLELERLHSHLLWTGLASHILGFDTLFMQCFRIREPIMWMAERITGNRKTYGLCVVGGVRWDITPEIAAEMREMLRRLEGEWSTVVGALSGDRNLQRRTRGIGVTDPTLVKDEALLGPVARAAGVATDCRRDLPYAAYDKVEFNVVVQEGGDVWARLLVRAQEVFESVRIIRQCLDMMPAGPIQTPIDSALPAGRIGLSSVEAPRGEAHHFVITGDENRPRRWRVRAPTYQNLQAIPAMIKDQQLADMTISLGSIDPCFSCTDRLEVIDVRSGKARVYSPEELAALVREGCA